MVYMSDNGYVSELLEIRHGITRTGRKGADYRERYRELIRYR